MAEWINGVVLGRLIPLLLVGAGLFYGARLKFFHLLQPRAVLRGLLGGGKSRGESLRAVSLSLAGTLGVGNLVGVASAIRLGGAGAIFWMWISALCAMILKYAEIVLAMRYRKREGGEWHGSAMLYLQAFFRKKGYPVLGRLLGGLFAVLCLVNALTMGSMIQVHAVSEAMEGVAGIPSWVVGAVLALVTLLILHGGRTRLLQVSAKLVPFMTAGFLLLSAAALFLCRDRIPEVLRQIVTDALSGQAAAGGVGGFLLGRSVRYGTMRGLLSNEAGCGTAPMAHGTAEGAAGVRQGLWGIFEVFADTILLCTVTALVILSAGIPLKGDAYMMITVDAYVAHLGGFAAYFLTAAVLLFGFATVICWGHYGREGVAYLTPSKGALSLFHWIYAFAVLVGAVGSSRVIWQTADLAMGWMTAINVPVLCLMSKEVQEATEAFLKTKRKRKKKESHNFHFGVKS